LLPAPGQRLHDDPAITTPPSPGSAMLPINKSRPCARCQSKPDDVFCGLKEMPIAGHATTAVVVYLLTVMLQNTRTEIIQIESALIPAYVVQGCGPVGPTKAIKRATGHDGAGRPPGRLITAFTYERSRRSLIRSFSGLRSGGARKKSTFPAARRDLNLLLIGAYVEDLHTEIVRGWVGTNVGIPAFSLWVRRFANQKLSSHVTAGMRAVNQFAALCLHSFRATGITTYFQKRRQARSRAADGRPRVGPHHRPL
jgi:hypothetical protein